MAARRRWARSSAMLCDCFERTQWLKLYYCPIAKSIGVDLRNGSGRPLFGASFRLLSLSNGFGLTREQAVDLRDHSRTFSNRRRNTFGRACADIADREHAAHAGLQRQSRAAAGAE